MIKQIILGASVILAASTAAMADTYQKIGDCYYRLTTTPWAGEDGVLQAAVSTPTGSLVWTDDVYTGDIVIPDFVEYEGQKYAVTGVANYCFTNQSRVTSITCPETLVTIGSQAFGRCALTSFTIPASVESIAYDIFNGCYDITDITSLATVPPATVSGSFHSLTLFTSKVTLYVPEGSVSAYQEAAEWSKFNSIEVIPSQQILPTSIQFNEPSFTGLIGEKFTLTATVLPEDADDKRIVYTNSNPDVATFDETTGEITLRKLGTTVITATSHIAPEVKAEFTVVCQEDPRVFPESMELNTLSITQPVTATHQIVATVYPADAFDKEIRYVSSDPEIASVTPDGLVTCLKEGISHIYVTCAVKPSVGANLSVIVKSDQLTLDNITYRVNPATNEATVIGHDDNLGKSANIPTTFKAPFSERNVYTPTGIGDGAFADTDITDINMPGTIRGIGQRAFAGCASIQAVTLPEGVITVGAEAFSGCTSLVALHLPSTVASLGQRALWNVAGLHYLRCDAVLPPALPDTDGGYGEVFDSGIWPGCNLVVAAASTDDYASRAGWEKFSNVTGWDKNNIAVEGITITPSTIKGRENTDVELTFDFLPAGARATNLYAYSSNPDVAEVYADTSDNHELPLYRVNLRKEGTAQITVWSGMSSNTCDVTVDNTFNSISGIATDADLRGDVYSIDGRLMLRDADSSAVRTLPAGFYIHAGRKVMVK